MKRILFVCALILVINQSIFSQDSDKKWTIQMNPLLLFSDIFISGMDDTLFIIDLEGQYKISNNSNISLTLSFLYNDRTFSDYDYYSNSVYYYRNDTAFQIGIKPMYIHRPFETGLKGFFIGIYPNIGFQYITIDNNTTLYKEIGFGLDVGYKWVFDSGFTMQLGGGLGKTFSFPPKSNPDAFINSDGRITVVRSDISIFNFKLGYSF